MEIINSHIHLGTSHILDSNYTEEQLLADMKRNGLSGMMVYPLVEPQPDNIEGHNRIHRFAQAHPGQVWGVVDMHPRHLEEDYCREVRRCVRDLGFVAIKLHPYLHGVNPNNSCTTKCFDMARELSVPIIIHTGLGIPFSLPALVTRRARQYPDVKIVLAHAGGQMFSQEAIFIAEMFENIYLEPSWCQAYRIKEFCSTLGKERVIFGSDGPANTMVEIAKVESVNLPQEQREWYFAKAARKLYNLK